MRRLKLSTKMLVAALPLILAVTALLALTVRHDLQAIDRAESGAELGRMWDPLIDTLTAIEAEAAATDGPDATLRRATDDSINVLRSAASELNAATAAGDHITASRSSLSAARRTQDMSDIAPDLVEIEPVQAYAQASREIVAVGQLLPSEAGDPALGRELLAVVKLAEAKLAGNSIIANVDAWEADPSSVAALRFARDQFGTLETVLGEFEAIAPEEWASQLREAGFAPAVARARGQLDTALRTAQTGDTIVLDLGEFETLVDGSVQFQVEVSNQIVDRASNAVDAQRQSTLRRLGIALGVTLAAVALAWLVARSITKRIRAVSAGAQRVTTEQLPALVEAIRDPRGHGALPAIEPVTSRGTDELAELADSFNTMQGTLVDVAHQQVEVLRRGVSDIFVTMARRNRSLIDRQLAMLDEFEAEVDDPEVLANYYQLDHMATRMRRNSESLLVLANAEPKRRRVKATEVDDVVRAAIGEVEDYRRIEIEALESLQVRGNVVADVSHLLAELLDNATSFSPPDSVVRVGGRMGDKGYMIRILDAGVGIGSTRLAELNTILREPPVVGLSVESTLGMSVVSLLANKHGISVTLALGNPGLIVDVVLPPTLFGPIDAHAPLAAAPAIGTPTDEPAAIDDATSIVAWDDGHQTPDLATIDVAAEAERFEQIDPYEPIENERPAAHLDDEDRPVTTSDWRAMSLSLSAFQSGMQSAQEASTENAGSPLERALDAAEAVSEAEGDSAAIADDHPMPEPTMLHDTLSEVAANDDSATETATGTEAAIELDAHTTANVSTDAISEADTDDATAKADTEVTEAVTELDAHTAADANTISEAAADTDAVTEFDTDTYADTMADADTNDDSTDDADTHAVTELDAHTTADADTISEADTDDHSTAYAYADRDAVTEFDTDTIGEADTDDHSTAYAYADRDAVTEFDTDTYALADVDTNDDSTDDAHTHAMTELDPHTMADANTIPEADTDDHSTAYAYADTMAGAETEAGSDSDAVTDFDTETVGEAGADSDAAADFGTPRPTHIAAHGEPTVDDGWDSSEIDSSAEPSIGQTTERELPSFAELAAAVIEEDAGTAPSPYDDRTEPAPSLHADHGDHDDEQAEPVSGLLEGEPVLPPPAGPRSEFDLPPAPPLTVAGPSATPVSPNDARRIPAPKVPEPSVPSLPTRTPGAGPDGGPDRLAGEGDVAHANNGTHGEAPASLPTRSPAEPVDDTDDSPTVGAADPGALRDRLRAFQAEFRSALGTASLTDTTTGTDTATETRTASEHNDLGEDR